ncbi:metal-dependent phosphohydrolase HD sub domain protein [Coriobacterium glomerans PW2]|uniref:Metal-dependent phosphohydrolase HD sub domain protein n=1 Tax=Coriobacterium glomerans (strain ATCC 49209 / DSM 20642 / JCM 10262 / PW2) TaxID=700015 RepID=F2N807_CORGP|nr:HD domain-containing protein [Coriobacterium glomerans]AEB07116.1 metal-dependent phosphohydrolase HD sub domain protein [Coriobacterium glomerans PW2]
MSYKASNRSAVRRRMATIPDSLSDGLVKRMLSDRAQGWRNPLCSRDVDARRRHRRDRDTMSAWRPSYVRDVEKIMHIPAYNRYAGKTQVFSFRSNDDLSRRGLHVQLVARIARDIGYALGLNTDLIEAIGLGHDLGHTPFGHAGERCLNEVYRPHCGRWFLHNVQSVRVLDVLYGRNLTLQTLDGALCHNGEYEQRVFELSERSDFEGLDRAVEACRTTGEAALSRLRPMTLEACVVRISDIIAYVGRDRQDAIAAGLLEEDAFEDGLGGAYNSWILSHASADIIEHSYGRDRIEMSEALFCEIRRAKAENYEKIYRASGVEGKCSEVLSRAFQLMYEKFLADLLDENESSYIFRHHINRLESALSHYGRHYDWRRDPDQTVVDYIASMTDGYFTELATKLFPDLCFPRRTYIRDL